MKRRSFDRVVGLVLGMLGMCSFLLAGADSVKSTENMGKIYEKRCANCHGVEADGVPKIKEEHGVEAEEGHSKGIASEEKTNIYGSPLNRLSKEYLVAKLYDLRNKSFDSESYHSVMQWNLKRVEATEGKIIDEKMAEYIYKTFGSKAD